MPVWTVNGSIERAPRRSAGAASRPATAVAAATGGETMWVREPLPWRPSKLRLLVEAARWPGRSRSSLSAAHIEQPAAGRKSAPAAAKMRSRPSASACRRTCAEPGTISMSSPAATRRPASTSAAARRSSIRPLVHEPTKTVSIATSRSAVPGRRSM